MTDKKTQKLIEQEQQRQQETLQMIPSENIASDTVLQALGSPLTNKYSEGYPKKRYYQGNEVIDKIELLAIERAKTLFGVPYANVQAYSGSPANAAIYFGLLEPGDTVMGLDLASGGHLTHGHPKITFSGKYFNSVQYEVEEDGLIDYDKLRETALKHKPKIIVSGGTAYPRLFDFERFAAIADEVGAKYLADISHTVGLMIHDTIPSPAKHADIVMFTTHKTLRGPRGAIILTTHKGLKKDEKLAKKIDRAIFPGLQGGPHNNTTAAIAIALKEADSSKFKNYANQTVANAKTLANDLTKHGFNLVTKGTDNHLLLIDLRNKKGEGWCAAWALYYAGIVVNRNAIPHDPNPPYYPSGIRLGTPAITTRGMKESEMILIAKWITDVINASTTIMSDELYSSEKSIRVTARKEFKQRAKELDDIKKIRIAVAELCKKFPIYEK